MSVAPAVAGLLLAAALLVRPSAPVRLVRASRLDGSGPDRSGSGSGRSGRGRRPWSRRGRGAQPPDQDLLSASVAERAAALLRAGVAPSVAWEHAVGSALQDAEVGPDEGPGRVAEVVAPVRAVWELVQRTGAPAAEALDAGAAGLRADAAARAAVRTALAGARVSARTVSALPVLGLLLGTALGARPWAVLVGTGPGRVCAVLGVALLLLGRWWSARLVRVAEAAGR